MSEASGRAYLDYLSGAPMRLEVRTSIQENLDAGVLGDPSRPYREAIEARETIERARESVAGLFGVPGRSVTFTSSGTEANNLAVYSACRDCPDGTVIVSALDHSSVRKAAERWASRVTEVPVDRTSVTPDLGALGHLMERLQARGEEVAFVACQAANHDTGVVQPVREILDLCRDRGVACLVDACAAFGYLASYDDVIAADYVSVTAHKAGGPAGAGLLLAPGPRRVKGLILGAEQERARRAGFENTAAIVGMGALAGLLGQGDLAGKELERYRSLSHALRCHAEASSGLEVLLASAAGLPNVTLLSTMKLRAEAVLIGLDGRGVSVHSGSSCSSEAFVPSEVFGHLAIDGDTVLRLSVGWRTTEADITRFTAECDRVLAGLAG